jgi:hypothetical protein
MLIKIISGLDKSLKKLISANTLNELLSKGNVFIKYGIRNYY